MTSDSKSSPASIGFEAHARRVGWPDDVAAEVRADVVGGLAVDRIVARFLRRVVDVVGPRPSDEASADVVTGAELLYTDRGAVPPTTEATLAIADAAAWMVEDEVTKRLEAAPRTRRR